MNVISWKRQNSQWQWQWHNGYVT